MQNIHPFAILCNPCYENCLPKKPPPNFLYIKKKSAKQIRESWIDGLIKSKAEHEDKSEHTIRKEMIHRDNLVLLDTQGGQLQQ